MSLIDLVIAEYKWSYEATLNLSIGVLRRILEAIRTRKLAEYKSEATLVEWQTKTLARFIGAISQDAKQSASLQKEANKLSLVSLLDKAQADIGSDDDGEQAQIAGGSEQDFSYIEQGSATAAERNSAGTAELLMHGFRS